MKKFLVQLSSVLLALGTCSAPAGAQLSQQAISRLTTPPVPTSVKQLSDEEKRMRGIPTTADLEKMTREYLLYDRYEQTLDRLREAHDYNSVHKLNLLDLLDFTKNSCAFLGTREQGFAAQDALELASQSSLSTVDEHFGVALAMSVYYRCPRHTDTFHDWMFQFNTN